MAESPDPTQSLDKAWTWVGVVLVGINLIMFSVVRYGSESWIRTATAGDHDEVSVSASYWGALVAASGLSALGALALRYKRMGFAVGGFGWPRFQLTEGVVRDEMVARATFAVLLLTPLAVWYASLYVYADSRIAEWRSTKSLADGFWSSRLKALSTPCDDAPCFRMLPLDAAPLTAMEPTAMEWIPYLNDPLLAVMSLAALVLWIRWLVLRRKALRPA